LAHQNGLAGSGGKEVKELVSGYIRWPVLT
jgi:hypothetical protein